MAARTIVYIDGFNFYHGAVKGGPHKWLDLQRLFVMLRNGEQIEAIRYFTAPITGPKLVNQQTYLRALETLPLVEVVLGKFKLKKVTCLVAPCAHGGGRLFSTYEEKRTDVNIGVRLVDDAYQNLCDKLVVVSGDSDLVPALNLVKARFPAKEIIVYVPSRNPTRGAAVELRAAADKDRTFPLGLLRHAQFPARVPDGAGGFITKPAGW